MGQPFFGYHGIQYEEPIKTMAKLSSQQLKREFERQIGNLLRKDYPRAAGMSAEEFCHHISPLSEKAENLVAPDVDLEKGVLPFVIVIKGELVSAERAMALAEKDGRNGVTVLRPRTSADFSTISEVSIPGGPAYILGDIDRGKAYINIPPREALRLIRNAGRSPLTIHEGIAVVTHFPEFLMRNNCFSLPASRTGKDQRVPAIWINAKNEPNLGWCWDGTPHTWLGSASASLRVGA